MARQGGGRRGRPGHGPGTAADRLSARRPGAEARICPPDDGTRPSGWSMPPAMAARRCCSVRVHAEEGVNFNACILAEGGRMVGRTLKHELPNYGTFDEKRIFAHWAVARADPVPRREARRSDLRGHLAGVGLRPSCPRRARKCCWCPTAAPMRSTRTIMRQRLVRERVVETGLPMVYLNRVGGQDELVFDGSSFVTNDDGEYRGADARFRGGDGADGLGSHPQWLALRAGREVGPLTLSGGHVPGDDVRASRLCRRKRLSRRDPRACRAGSTAHCRLRWRSTRWAPTRCGA